MRFLFKTSYLQDIRLAKHGGHAFWYGAARAGDARRALGRLRVLAGAAHLHPHLLRSSASA